MAFARKKKKQEQRKAVGGGGLAALAALGGAVLLWRKSRNRTRPVTQSELGIDDNTLANKVRTEIFRDDSVPKGDINVNSEFGVVFLRGRVDSEDQKQSLELATRGVEGVKDVRNLLDTADTPTPAA